MKTFFLSLIPITLVCFAFFGFTRCVRLKPWTKPGQEEAYQEFRQISAIPTVDSSAAALPKLECSEAVFNFGIMPPFANGTHIFKVTNSGTAPLAVRSSGTSCNCTETDFTAKILQPAEMQEIEVTWDTNQAGNFAQYLKLTTNSPETPELELWVEGTVSTILDASVSALEFGDLMANETRSQEFFLFSSIWDEIEIDRIETSSENIQCKKISKSKAQESSEEFNGRKPEQPISIKSRVDLRMTAIAQEVAGPRTEHLRIYVRPPAIASNSASDGKDIASDLSLRGLYKSLQQDGTLLIELPVETVVLRRFSLYGPAIADGRKKLIDLGKLRTKSPSREWTLIARVRGDRMPVNAKVSLVGIDGVSASIEEIESTAIGMGISYRIKIRAQENLPMAAYNRETAGKLIIETPGIPNEELLEFNVELDVLEEN